MIVFSFNTVVDSVEDEKHRLTQREIVEKYMPNNVDDCYGGGVLGCPNHSDYFHLFKVNDKCEMKNCDDLTCDECWDLYPAEDLTEGGKAHYEAL